MPCLIKYIIIEVLEEDDIFNKIHYYKLQEEDDLFNQIHYYKSTGGG